jgi:hypothetical protein
VKCGNNQYRLLETIPGLQCLPLPDLGVIGVINIEFWGIDARVNYENARDVILSY